MQEFDLSTLTWSIRFSSSHKGVPFGPFRSWHDYHASLGKDLLGYGRNTRTIFILWIYNLGGTSTLEFLAEMSFTPLLCHSGGCLGCPEKLTSSRNYNLLGPLFFSQNGINSKKPTKIIKIQWKVTVFWHIFKVCSILAGKQRPKPIRWT